MKVGDLVRTRTSRFTSSEYFAGTRISIKVFPLRSHCASCGDFQPHQLGIILEVDYDQVKIYVPDGGVIGWVGSGYLEVISEPG